MARNQNDFLQPLLELMQKNYNDLSTKVEENTKLTQKAYNQARDAHKQAKITNGRVTGAEKRIVKIESKIDKRSWVAYVVSLPSKVLYLLALGCLIILLIIAQKLNVDLTGLFNGQA